MQNKFSNFRKEFEEEIGSEEINKDVFNELRMEELKEKDKSKHKVTFIDKIEKESSLSQI